MTNNLEILNKIELEFAEQDTRWQFRWILNWKTLFREASQQDFDNKIKSINDFFSGWNIVIEKETSLPYKISKNKNFQIFIDFTINKILTWKNEYFINSKYLESPIWKAKYTAKSYELTSQEFEKMTLTENEKLKIIFLEKLEDISNFYFIQNWYSDKLVNAYKILISEVNKNEIQITNSEKIIIGEWTHRVIALTQLLQEWKSLTPYSLDKLKNKIKTFLIDAIIIESKTLSWDISFEDMKVLDFSEVEMKVDQRIRNVVENG